MFVFIEKKTELVFVGGILFNGRNDIVSKRTKIDSGASLTNLKDDPLKSKSTETTSIVIVWAEIVRKISSQRWFTVEILFIFLYF
jgi:hypothetical protein